MSIKYKKLYRNTERPTDIVTIANIIERYAAINGNLNGFDEYYANDFLDESGHKEYVPLREIRIRLEQDYLANRDCTVIWEIMEDDERCYRQRIVGCYYGKPQASELKSYAYGGVELIDFDAMEDLGVYNV